jgi:hypothetical protein
MMYGDKSATDLAAITGDPISGWGFPGYSEGAIYGKGILKNIGLDDKKELIEQVRGFMWVTTYTGPLYSTVSDMFTHFLDGTSTDYSNDALTDAVLGDAATKKYVGKVKSVLKKALNKSEGNLKTSAFSKTVKDGLSGYANRIKYSDYTYGLMIAIHIWTEIQLDVTSYSISGKDYNGTVRVTFSDNFGLDANDIGKYKDVPVAGLAFRAWYALQHYSLYKDKHKPFRVRVVKYIDFSGKLP